MDSPPGRSPSWAPSSTGAPEDETPPPPARTPPDEDRQLLLRSRIMARSRREALQAWWNRLQQTNPVAAKALIAALTSALGAALGSCYRRRSFVTNSSTITTTTKSIIVPGGRRTATRSKSNSKPEGMIDWWEVLSFGICGGLLGGPAAHHWDSYLAEHGPETTPTQLFLLDQLVVQPPRLLVVLTVVEVLRKALQAVPSALREAAADVSTVTATSWKFWPLAVYLLRRKFKCDSTSGDKTKNKRRYKLGLNVCVVVWTAYLAQRRATMVRP